MESTITATHLARNLADVLNRVRYRGERFVVERAGEPIAVIEPVGPVLGTTLAEAARRLQGIEWPDEDFADDLEEIHASQTQMAENPWDR